MASNFNATFQIRRDTTENWLRENPILRQGEPALNLTNNSIKIGDGVTNWKNLKEANPYSVQETLVSRIEIAGENISKNPTAPGYAFDYSQFAPDPVVKDYSETINIEVFAKDALNPEKEVLLTTFFGSFSPLDPSIIGGEQIPPGYVFAIAANRILSAEEQIAFANGDPFPDDITFSVLYQHTPADEPDPSGNNDMYMGMVTSIPEEVVVTKIVVTINYPTFNIDKYFAQLVQSDLKENNIDKTSYVKNNPFTKKLKTPFVFTYDSYLDWEIGSDPAGHQVYTTSKFEVYDLFSIARSNLASPNPNIFTLTFSNLNGGSGSTTISEQSFHVESIMQRFSGSRTFLCIGNPYLLVTNSEDSDPHPDINYCIGVDMDIANSIIINQLPEEIKKQYLNQIFVALRTPNTLDSIEVKLSVNDENGSLDLSSVVRPMSFADLSYLLFLGGGNYMDSSRLIPGSMIKEYTLSEIEPLQDKLFGSSVAIGAGARISSHLNPTGIAIGKNASGGDTSVALGPNSSATGNSIAIGEGAQSRYTSTGWNNSCQIFADSVDNGQLFIGKHCLLNEKGQIPIERLGAVTAQIEELSALVGGKTQ